jgi:hypothetical protein
MKFPFSFLAFFLLVPFLLLTGCSDEPGSVGASLLSTDGSLQVVDTTLFAVSDTVFTTPFATGAGTSILVGTWNGYSAVALVKFATTYLADSLGAAHIDGARIRFTNSYSWQLGATQRNYIVQPVSALWTESYVTRDSLDRIWTSRGAKCGSYSSAFTIGDTSVILLDTATVRRWLANKPDSTGFNGFIISDSLYAPNTSTAANGIVGFSAFATSTPPHLLVSYTLGGVSYEMDVSSGEDAYLATGAISADPTTLETQAGISIRSKVLFDLSGVPKGSIVNAATFSISAKDRTVGVGTPDSIIVFPSTSAADPNQMNESYYAFGAKTDTTGKMYSIASTSFRAIAQRWITGYANNGLVLRSASDGYSIDRLRFYRTSAADSLRPRLRLIYTKKN